MSRHCVEIANGTVVAYGLDHVLGYFYEKFDIDKLELDDYFPTECYGRAKVLEALYAHGELIPHEHIMAIAMDLPL
jgi:hypothetical protein